MNNFFCPLNECKWKSPIYYCFFFNQTSRPMISRFPFPVWSKWTYRENVWEFRLDAGSYTTENWSERVSRVSAVVKPLSPWLRTTRTPKTSTYWGTRWGTVPTGWSQVSVLYFHNYWAWGAGPKNLYILGF